MGYLQRLGLQPGRWAKEEVPVLLPNPHRSSAFSAALVSARAPVVWLALPLQAPRATLVWEPLRVAKGWRREEPGRKDRASAGN